MIDIAQAQCILMDSPTQPEGWIWDPESGTQSLSSSWGWDPRTQANPIIRETPTEVVSPDQHDPELTIDPVITAISSQFARIIAEALDGRRRLSQLESHFESRALMVLSQRLHRLRGSNVRLASMRVQQATKSSAEVTLRLSTARLNHAAALKVMYKSGRWVCTDLVVG
ncbi:MAG: Rv3235 family protein [Propionibacteriaceae bacterium]|jgi:hypothetical protein|nr:Rv3235 family protein [Propionibacteriaceae bacterium]